MAADVARAEKLLHVATYETTTFCTVCMCAHVQVRMCAHARTCVRVCNLGESTLLRSFAAP